MRSDDEEDGRRPVLANVAAIERDDCIRSKTGVDADFGHHVESGQPQLRLGCDRPPVRRHGRAGLKLERVCHSITLSPR
jgi:hypothetical protein